MVRMVVLRVSRRGVHGGLVPPDFPAFFVWLTGKEFDVWSPATSLDERELFIGFP